MKDRSRTLVLVALIVLFVVLVSNGNFFHGFRLFGPNRMMTMLLIGVGIWLICGGCKGGCCRWPVAWRSEDIEDEATDTSDSEESGEEETDEKPAS